MRVGLYCKGVGLVFPFWWFWLLVTALVSDCLFSGSRCLFFG